MALTVAMVRPGLHDLLEGLPENTGDPALLTWILAWGGHAAVTAPLGWFDANIFWPHPSTLAYSDPMLPVVPVFWLVYGPTQSWALSLNLTHLALVVLNLAATFALARRLLRRDDAALVAAVAFAFGPYVTANWGHVQLQTIGFVPLALLLLLRVLDTHDRRTAALLGVANAAVVLAAVYHGVIWAMVAAVVVAGHLGVTRFRPGPGLLPCLAVAGAVTAALAVPALLPYLDLQEGAAFRRTLAEVGALEPRDLLTPPAASLLWGPLRELVGSRGYDRDLFPGGLVLALAAVGLVALLRRPPAVDDVRRREVALVALGGLVALLLAAGPELLGLPGPFRLLFHHVPGFSGIRVPSRFAAVALLALAVLAGLGYARATAHLRGRPAARAAVVMAAALVLVDVAASRTWAELPDDEATLAVYHALDRRPPAPVLELPIVDPVDPVVAAAWPWVEAPRVLYSTLDWNERVNGYSGFVPPSYLADVDVLATFPAPEALAWLEANAVRYVVLHVGVDAGFPMYTEAQADAVLAALPPGAAATRHGPDWLVDLGPG